MICIYHRYNKCTPKSQGQNMSENIMLNISCNSVQIKALVINLTHSLVYNIRRLHIPKTRRLNYLQKIRSGLQSIFRLGRYIYAQLSLQQATKINRGISRVDLYSKSETQTAENLLFLLPVACQRPSFLHLVSDSTFQ